MGRNKEKSAAEVGFHTVDVTLPDTASQEEIIAEVHKLNEDSLVHGILVQLPLPPHVDEAAVLLAIKHEKDVDGFSAMNIGNLCMKGGDPPPVNERDSNRLPLAHEEPEGEGARGRYRDRRHREGRDGSWRLAQARLCRHRCRYQRGR